MTSIANGIKTINCESAIEAFRINKIAEELGRKVDILIRVNTNYHIDGAEEHMAGISTKMGIDEDDVSAIYNVIKYSLQGTTQGNGLTGGLPPVRFSM